MAVDALVIRHHASGACHQVAQWVDASVINAGDGTHEHPTQALLDAYALRNRIGDLDGRHVAIVGDLTHSRVFRSNVITLGRLGAHVTVVAPPTLMPSGIADWSKTDGFATSWDLDEVLEGGGTHGPVDAVMMLRVQRERMSGGYFPTAREYTVTYGLTRDRMRRLTAAQPRRRRAPPGSDEPRPGDRRRCRRLAQRRGPGPGLGRRRGADGRALPPAQRRDRSEAA